MMFSCAKYFGWVFGCELGHQQTMFRIFPNIEYHEIMDAIEDDHKLWNALINGNIEE